MSFDRSVDQREVVLENVIEVTDTNEDSKDDEGEGYDKLNLSSEV